MKTTLIGDMARTYALPGLKRAAGLAVRLVPVPQPTLLVGAGSSRRLGEAIGAFAHAKILLVTDAVVLKLGLARSLMDALKASRTDVVVYAEVTPDAPIALDEVATIATCERIFAATLDGHPLVANRSLWRRFPKVRNARWSVGSRVLIGDALRTAHFSIGSGTRLALEDSIALARALREHPVSVADALAAFEAARSPVVDKLVAAADASANWYERFAEHMRLEPWELAWQYIQRSGRVDLERLRQVSPGFVAGYTAQRALSSRV